MNHDAEIFQSAFAALQAGNPVMAEQNARRRLFAKEGDYESWMLLLAMALHSQGRLAEAVDAYAALTRRYPKSATHWGNLGTVLRQARRHEEAEAAYCQAIVLDPANALHFVHIGLLLVDMGNQNSARNAFLQAVEIDPGATQARIHGSLVCFQCGDDRSARRLLTERDDWRRASDLQMEDRLTLSSALLLLGHTDDAEQVLHDALAVAGTPQIPLVQARLAALYERLNRLDEAHRIAAQLPDPTRVTDVGLSREIAGVHARLARRGDDLDGAKERLEDLAEQPQTSAQDEATLMFALAKVCDKQDDTAGAMRALQQAHVAQLRHLTASKGLIVDPAADPLAPLMPSLSAEQFARWPVDIYHHEDPRPDPIFIVGFPRSGTTLLEQMLDAIPGLHSMDEREFMRDIVNHLQEAGTPYPDSLGGLSNAQCDEMRSMYWTGVAKIVSLEPGERLVDKNPLNLLLLPLIHRLFPDSRIILALRHPCDVVLSCYMQHFGMPIFVDMCSSLERLARSYVHAMQQWIDHEHLLQPKVLHLRHERMLADFDAHVREIGDFLGLDNAEAMRDFQGHALRKGYIATPSYDQVIQPLNTSAVGRWRRYESYFRDVVPILRPIIEHWGYAD